MAQAGPPGNDILIKEIDMKKLIRLVSSGALLAAVALLPAGPARAQDSGFLGDYADLSEVTDAAGAKVKRYVNPKFKPGAYQAVVLDPTQYYPAPKPTDQVSASTLTDISRYVDKGLREQIGAKVKLVSEPGPGVLRMKPAITAVMSKSESLKAYQYIPIAFLVTEVKGRDKEATMQIEVDLVDSLSGERMGAAVRKGVGEKLPNKEASLTLMDVMPLLNKWIETGASFLAENMK
jgi:hypothetical protein